MATASSASAFLGEILQRVRPPTSRSAVGSIRKLLPCLEPPPLRKCQSETVTPGPTEFGLFFDIDGVITRGRTLLPHSKAAFKLLLDDHGKLIAPTIFVTNAGNSMRESKAKQLTDWLDIKIEPDQVIMSHSPLRMFKQSHDKHMLISGQGPIEEIATALGFTNVTTMDVFRQCFPALDTVDHKRRKPAPCAFEKYFPKIEGIIMFGEPVRWESSLQMIIDVLMSDGRPSKAISKIPYPHLPILACNMDLVWMSEAPMPRFGHGSFMTCLEALYRKITGYELKYSAQVGKPSEITYHYAEHMLQSEARRMNLPRIRRMYCIGDNPAVDIYGANLFNRRVQKKLEKSSKSKVELLRAATRDGMRGGGGDGGGLELDQQPPFEVDPSFSDPPANLELSSVGQELIVSIDSCESILVCTGVFQGSADGGALRAGIPLQKQKVTDTKQSDASDGGGSVRGSPTGPVMRDHVMDVSLCTPSVTTAHNVLEAVISVLEKEGIHRTR